MSEWNKRRRTRSPHIFLLLLFNFDLFSSEKGEQHQNTLKSRIKWRGDRGRRPVQDTHKGDSFSRAQQQQQRRVKGGVEKANNEWPPLKSYYRSHQQQERLASQGFFFLRFDVSMAGSLKWLWSAAAAADHITQHTHTVSPVHPV